jgi:endonuclease/exonuclease/phosphatase family metal-dependent hydrolase
MRWVLLMLMGLLAGLAPNAWGEDGRVSILTYNIYWGGQPHDPVFERDHEWLHVIEARNPDVIIINEANGWLPDEANLIAAYVDSLNAAFPDRPPYAGYVGDARSSFNVALLARIPVMSFEAFTDVETDSGMVLLAHVIVCATLDLEGERVHVIGVHFRPGDHRVEREREARALLAILDGLSAGGTVWIGGDFNSYSPVDIAPGSLTPPDYAAGADPPETKGWEPMGYLLDRGFEDAFRTFHPLVLGYTQDTSAFVPGGVPKQRVDFLVRSAGSAWRLASAETADDGLGDIASDHYAVFACYQRADAGATEGTAAAPLRLSAWPNPSQGAIEIALDLADAGCIRAEIISPEGRRVGTLVDRWLGRGVHRFCWSGDDRFGRPLDSGTYFVRCRTPRGETSLRMARIAITSR